MRIHFSQMHLKCKTTIFLSCHLLTISSFAPYQTHPSLPYTLVIIFFLDVTHTFENCSFMLSLLEQEGKSTVGRVSVIPCFDGRDRWWKEGKEEWRQGGGNNGVRQWRDRWKFNLDWHRYIYLSERGWQAKWRREAMGNEKCDRRIK